jgi:3-oxosteroid 1-dehydrogenase
MRNIVIVGTGAAGLVAAITAAECGLRVTLLEKANQWGGTSSWSGGALWIPAHPLMLENGVSDSLESARAYMDSCISQSGEASSPERRDAYLRTGPEMVRFLADVGMKWEFSPFPDYYMDPSSGIG